MNQESSLHEHLKVLLPVQAIYLSFAFYNIGHQSLWADEVTSIMRAATPEGPILSWDIWFGSQCPLYYVLLRLWSRIGSSETVLRSLSVLLGAIALGLTYATALKLFDRRVAAIGATLLATSPFLIWYSQEVRYTTLLLATSLFANYSFLHASSSDRIGWWVAYFLGALLAVFSFVSGVFLLVAHGAYLLWSGPNSHVLRRWLGCQFVTFVLFTTWFGVQYGNPFAASSAPQAEVSSYSLASSLNEERKRLSDLLLTIPYTFFVFSSGFSMGPSVAELHVSRSVSSLSNYAPTLFVLGLVFATLFVLGILQLRQNSEAGKFLVLWLCLPIIAVLLAVVSADGFLYNVRYVAAVFPAYMIILAAGINGFQRNAIKVCFVAAVMAVNAVSVGQYYFEPRYAREDGRSAARYLELAARPGDAIVAVGNTTALRYYYKGDLPTADVDARNSEWVVLHDLRKLGKKHNRLWLVEIRRWEEDPAGRIKDTLDNLAFLGEHKRFPGGVDISMYDFTHQ